MILKLRHFVYLFAILLIVIAGTTFLALRSQATEVNRLAIALAPIIDTNRKVFEAMTEANSGLLGYQISNDPSRLTMFLDARTRALAALVKLQDKLVSWPEHNATDYTLNMDLGVRQHLAVQKWSSYAMNSERTVAQRYRIEILHGAALFDNFRRTNAALGDYLKIERDHTLDSARANSAAKMRYVMVATFAALVAILIVGQRFTRSVNVPIIGMRDTLIRQREGDLGARIREDFGFSEIRSLASEFNALAEKNLATQLHVEDVSARIASLMDLSLTLGQERSLEALLIQIVESARKVLDARYAAIGVLDVSGTMLAQFVTAGISPEENAAIGMLPQGRGLLGVIIRDPQVLRIEHMKDDPNSAGFPLHHPPMDSFLGVPILIKGKVFANLYLTDKIGGPFTAEDEQIVQSLALQVAVAVESVHRYEVERQRANMLESVREIEFAIRGVSDIQQALDVLCTALGEALGVDRVIAKVGDSDHKLRLGAQWHLASVGDLAEDLVPYIGPLAAELWRSSEYLAVDDLAAPRKLSQQGQIFHGYTDARAAIIVPIGLGDQVIGVIYVIMVQNPRQWTESEINAVQRVTAFVARIIVEAESRANQSEHIERLEWLEHQKSNFVATVSHELRTPLTSIIGYLELLQNDNTGQLTEDQQRMLDAMDRNASRLHSLIKNLLVLNQSESERLMLNVTDVSMRELIITTCQELYPLAQSGTVKLDINAGSEAAIIRGDRGQLQSVVVNIVTNAIKFSHPGGLVTIRCMLDQVAGKVRFTCQDHGIGISADDQSELFTRFYRASNATAQMIPGIGLGLSIVKQIVHDHGGQVRLTSVEGDGTTVVVDLPL